jgi:dihydroorotate dehydrogenase (NAD+) catalytic subunit
MSRGWFRKPSAHPEGLGDGVDLTTHVGNVVLRSPILTAAGTSGHGAELRNHVNLAALGAVVVKSLSAQAWAGNPPPRVWGTDAGMINSVGLQNEGVDHWVKHDLPALLKHDATVVASVWGFSIDAYHDAARKLRDVNGIAAVEVNVSCPNIEDRRHMFAHSIEGTTAVIGAVREALGPDVAIWAKLSPNVTSLTDIAGAALDAGANALTLINTVMGMVIDVESRRPKLGAGGGGLSGPAIRPVAVRAIYETRKQYPHAAIVGAGGVARGVDALELIMAGANAVEVGTATFYEPAASTRILREVRNWCHHHSITTITELIGAAHG